MASSLDDYINDESGVGLTAIMAKHKRDFYFVLFDDSIDNETKMSRIKVLMNPFREALKEYNLKSAPEFVDRNVGIIESNVNEITRVISEWNRLRQGKSGREQDGFIEERKAKNDSIIKQLSSAHIGKAELTEIFKLVEKQRKSIIEDQQRQDISEAAGDKRQKAVSADLEQDNEQADIEPATVDRETDDIGMKSEQGEKLVALVKELMSVRKERRKAEVAAAILRGKELMTKVEASLDSSSEQYLIAKKGMKELRSELEENMETAINMHTMYDGILAEEESEHYLRLDNARGKLGAAKMTMQLYKKELDVKLYIKSVEDIEKLEARLETETDEIEIATIQQDLKSKKTELETLETRENVKYYKEAKESIDPLKQTIKDEKAAMKECKWKRKDEKRLFIEDSKKVKAAFKEEKQNLLPAKQNMFMRAIGAIRAKLGIGKHKDEKNLADAMTRASEMLTTFAERTGESIKEGAIKAKSLSEKAIQDAQQATISGLESVLTKLIEAEKGHTKDAQTRQAPTQGDLEPSI